MLSDQYEITILRELRKPYHGGWLNAVHIADYTELPTYTVRAKLKQLVRRRLVARGNEAGRWGYFSITEHGIQELCQADQLRLVR